MPKPTQRSFSHSFFVYTTKLQTFLWTTARVVLCHQDSSWGAVSGSRLLAVLAGVQVLWVSFLQIEEGGGWGGEALTVQEVDYQLVGAHHDARVGYLAYQVGGETAVQGAEALLFGHCR